MAYISVDYSVVNLFILAHKRYPNKINLVSESNNSMQEPIKIDVIFLSYSKNEYLKNLTAQSIDTLIKSENSEKIQFNIIVIESNKAQASYQFENSRTIYPEEKFGFHKYLNIGIKATSNSYICLCNNDLIFHKGWASAILSEMQKDKSILSVSPFCPVTHTRSGFIKDSGLIEGYETLFSGWCFFVKRSIFEIIGLLDEKFIFWYADHDYLRTLQKFGVKNYLHTSSFVTHISSATTVEMDAKTRKKITLLPVLYLNYKYGRNNYLIYAIKYIYFYFRIKFNLI